MTNREFWGALVKQAREEMGITQLQLADEVDMDVRTIKKLETIGCNLPSDKMLSIIAFLHISPNICFHGEPTEAFLEMDRIYRLVQKFSYEQIRMIFENALHFKSWTDRYGEFQTLDEYYAILHSIRQAKHELLH